MLAKPRPRLAASVTAPTASPAPRPTKTHKTPTLRKTDVAFNYHKNAGKHKIKKISMWALGAS